MRERRPGCGSAAPPECFLPGWQQAVLGTALQQIWQDHLLVLSMLQHPERGWTFGRFVLLYPAGNTSFARASADYRAILRDPRTFEARTFEDLLAVPGALDDETKTALRERYF